MAEIFPLDEDAWLAWANERPECIRELARSLRPNLLYRMGESGHRCTLYAICEDGTVKVNVTGEYNWVEFDRTVFGVDPKTLTECDLPGPDEMLGTLLTDPVDIELLAMHSGRRPSNS